MLGVDWQIHANIRLICQSDGSSIRENQQILNSNDNIVIRLWQYFSAPDI